MISESRFLKTSPPHEWLKALPHEWLWDIHLVNQEVLAKWAFKKVINKRVLAKSLC
jgi:hypothetical protein